MRFTFDPTLDPGARVTAVDVWSADADAYTPIDTAAYYTIATNNYLAGGGDGYDYGGAADRYDTGWLLSDALAEYLTEVETVAPEIENRITIVEQSVPESDPEPTPTDP
jgi:5'-nucleotidase